MIDADYSFASDHSKTEVKGNVIDYRHTFEVKELSVPVNRADELKKFYRIIADERNTVVLKPQEDKITSVVHPLSPAHSVPNSFRR